MVGRPSKLTPEVIAKVGDLVGKLLHIETVADNLGVHRVTVHDWIRRGDREDARIRRGEEANPVEALYREFSYTVKKSLSDFERKCVEKIEAGKPGWQSAAWLLERRWYDRWGDKSKELKELQKLAKVLADGNRAGQGETQPEKGSPPGEDADSSAAPAP